MTRGVGNPTSRTTSPGRRSVPGQAALSVPYGSMCAMPADRSTDPVDAPMGRDLLDPPADPDDRAASAASTDFAGAAIPDFAERVLEVAERIPPGRVMTYGDIAEWLAEGGPRQVGRVMALYGGAVPWWRVIRADGALLPGSERRALERYRTEGTPLREAARASSGQLAPRVDVRRARWDGQSV